MGIFKYDDDELDINKVLKYNQDISNQMLHDKDRMSLQSTADNNINDSINLLRSLGYSEEVNNISSTISPGEYIHKPQPESWESIVNHANECYPGIIEGNL